MLSGEGNENGKKNQKNKNNNRSNQHKSNYARAAHFFCTFLCRCFARLLGETSRNFLVTHFMEGMSDVFLLTLFSLSLIFTLVAASIPPLQNFMLFVQQKMSPFIFCLSLQLLFSLSFAGLSPYFLFFSVFIQKHFPLSVFVFTDSLVVSASQDAVGHTLSRQNNQTFGIGLHVVGVRTVVRTLRHNQIFSDG